MPFFLSSATRRLAVVFALISGFTTLLAAQGTIRGRVIDATSQRSLPDVQLIVTGASSGVITNANGDYVISNVPDGQREVVARRLGFGRQSRKVTVGGGVDSRVDFALTASVTHLDEIVVTGTGGAVERKTLGNSITTVDVGELTSKTSIMNMTEVLQSKTPGVTILPGSGAPGTAGEIRIRGASSLSGYKPVVYIDGIRFNIDDLGGFSATGGGTAGLAQSAQVTSALNNLNPNDVESIEVIKGPAAATLYGAEAANGVIQIITKKGSRGGSGMGWSFRAERGTNEYTLLPGDNYTTCDATKRAAVVSATDTSHVWPGCLGDVPVNAVITGNPLRNDPRALRVGDLSRLSLSMRGGGDRYTYYMAGDRDTEQGVFFNSDNNNTSIRTNFGFNPTDKASVAINLNWQEGRIRLPIQDESANGLLLSARRGLPGRASLLGVGNEGWRTISPTAANRYENYTNTERFTLGGTFHYAPRQWFQNRLTVGFDNSLIQAQLLFLPGVIDASQDPDASTGANLRRTPTRKIVTIDYAGTMLWNATSSILATTTIGSQVVADKSTVLGATGIGIGAPDVTLVNLLQRSTGSEGFSENNSVGYYVQEQLGWKDRLFLTGAVRADDHSSFGTNFNLIVFPKFSVSYVLSEEPGAQRFLDAAHISSLKLRSAWGEAGRAPTAYSAPQTYTVNNVTLGTATASALRTSSFGNPDLKPERGEELELGFDMGLFKERAGVDFTYYDKKTKDLLQSVSIPPSTGFIGSRLTNLGEVSNKGVEVSLSGKPLDSHNFSWDTRLNYSTNKNVLVTFGIEGKTVDTPGGQAYGSVQQHRVGYPMGGYWVTPPQRAADGSAILTTAGAAIFNAGDSARRYIGPSSPTREMGFSNTVTFFKNFRVYVLFDHKGGGYIFNYQERNRCQSSDNCSRNNDPRARFPVTASDSILFKEIAVYKNTSVSPEWIQKADFTKLRELSLTVDMPDAWARLAGGRAVSFTFSGRNLKIWSDYEGVDPEVNTYGGRNFVRVDAYAAPMMRRLSASINLQY